jgi:hypothetical protein
MTKYDDDELRVLYPIGSNPEYWREIFRKRTDPIMAIWIYPKSPCLKILRKVAKEEGAVKTYRARSGWLKGRYVVEFRGLYSTKQKGG